MLGIDSHTPILALHAPLPGNSRRIVPQAGAQRAPLRALVAPARGSRRAAVSVVNYLTEHAPVSYKDLSVGEQDVRLAAYAPPAMRCCDVAAGCQRPAPHV